jgi:ribosomal protein S18 acetylase RimI-like enzyme
MTLINRQAVASDASLLVECKRVVLAEIPFFASSYPGFQSWFEKKVLPGICLGERSVVFNYRNGEVASFMILKHSTAEKKICTVRVREEFQNIGMGVRLFEEAFERLGTERPLLSVSDKNLSRFDRLFRHFGFQVKKQYRGLYLPQATELSYNGLLLQENSLASSKSLSDSGEVMKRQIKHQYSPPAAHCSQ